MFRVGLVWFSVAIDTVRRRTSEKTFGYPHVLGLGFIVHDGHGLQEGFVFAVGHLFSKGREARTGEERRNGENIKTSAPSLGGK